MGKQIQDNQQMKDTHTECLEHENFGLQHIRNAMPTKEDGNLKTGSLSLRSNMKRAILMDSTAMQNMPLNLHRSMGADTQVRPRRGTLNAAPVGACVAGLFLADIEVARLVEGSAAGCSDKLGSDAQSLSDILPLF